jgi:2-succinyl-5-enolpyruvyl-6-hydroxy-3-cyclohexene-1-carboxylate synthase
MLLIGDLSFLHDAGALQLAARLAVPLLVVVVNNDGGGIFHTLPAAELGDVFERCFATPHGLELGAALPPGSAGHIESRRVDSIGELDAALSDWTARPRPLVVEVRSERGATVELRKAMVNDAKAAAERTIEALR